VIVWGFRSRNKVLGKAAYQCSSCGQNAYHTGVRSTRWFTLFFIPVIPISKKTTARCGACGFQQQIDNKDADRIFTQAKVPAPQRA
jgi:hypothetical protein